MAANRALACLSVSQSVCDCLCVCLSTCPPPPPPQSPCHSPQDIQTDQAANLVIQGLHGKRVNNKELKAELFGQSSDGTGDMQPAQPASGMSACGEWAGGGRSWADAAPSSTTTLEYKN